MKTTLLSTLVLVMGTAALAFAPTGEARNFCSDAIDPGCPGAFCKDWDSQSRTWRTCLLDTSIECVTEPCPCTCPPPDEWWALP